MRKPYLIIAILAVMGIPLILYSLFMAFLLFLWPVYDDYANRVSFKENTWREADHGTAHPSRVQMVDDLLSRNDFHGKTKGEIITLLGETSDTTYFQDWDMVYWLGPERGLFGIDSEWLVFDLTEDARVSDYQLVRD